MGGRGGGGVVFSALDYPKISGSSPGFCSRVFISN